MTNKNQASCAKKIPEYFNTTSLVIILTISGTNNIVYVMLNFHLKFGKKILKMEKHSFISFPKKLSNLIKGF